MRWFHARTNMRRSTNAICQIECEDGSVATEEEEVQQVIVDCFANLFATSQPLHPEAIVASLEARVTDDMNNALCAPYSDVEVFKVLKMMHPNKAPRRDGLNALFYQRYWDVVGKEVSRALIDFLNRGEVPASFNHHYKNPVQLRPEFRDRTQNRSLIKFRD